MPRVTPSPDVLAHRFDEALVLVHLGTSQFYEMNPTGARLWELLAAGHSPAEVMKRLGEEYNVDPTRLNIEVRDILKQLTAANLVCEERP